MLTATFGINCKQNMMNSNAKYKRGKHKGNACIALQLKWNINLLMSL